MSGVRTLGGWLVGGFFGLLALGALAAGDGVSGTIRGSSQRRSSWPPRGSRSPEREPGSATPAGGRSRPCSSLPCSSLPSSLSDSSPASGRPRRRSRCRPGNRRRERRRRPRGARRNGRRRIGSRGRGDGDRDRHRDADRLPREGCYEGALLSVTVADGEVVGADHRRTSPRGAARHLRSGSTGSRIGSPTANRPTARALLYAGSESGTDRRYSTRPFDLATAFCLDP